MNAHDLTRSRWVFRTAARLPALIPLLVAGLGLASCDGGGTPARSMGEPPIDIQDMTFRGGITGATSFTMVRSAAAQAAGCLERAGADVTIVSLGPVEVMTVNVRGLPANTEFDFFVTQVPNAPFGLSWYQGDIETDGRGRGSGVFVGRFNIETFIVAPGSTVAPVVHDEPPFPDAATNPATAPVHTFHLGLWFNSPEDARAAGCPATVTPFNGDHTAGIQALSTRNFPDQHGPLRDVE
ncbi:MULTISPECIES: hypothetical protein [Sorangium]|uniref:Uncharacterized protein n=1 Tax=Sorangium cellulosum TaxID=56 RepID=A0A4P2R1J0_SORCE|nr:MULTISPECIES: hypothetical protein [Sorangium]AUX36807.1 uncharacterized protein SOCE836_090240 [Sorangium cellulosum]WCQ96103.1 hypothetical protein NQZ70_08887 [Sorangium sp. Soce836]